MDVIQTLVPTKNDTHQPIPEAFSSPLGRLFTCDCMELLQVIPEETVDMFFADPPFNVGKAYGKNSENEDIDDARSDEMYLNWCKDWIEEGLRILKPGGAMFLYNIARWNFLLAQMLRDQDKLKKPIPDKPKYPMRFRHWITININGQMPVNNMLMQHGYSLLYFIKGDEKTRPNVFHPIRTPVEYCRNPKCRVPGKVKYNAKGELVKYKKEGIADEDCVAASTRRVQWRTTQKDYGGYRQKYETQHGILLSDVWNDITAVRHSNFKIRDENQLSTRILERCIQMTTHEGDIVVDPFGGAGTTYAVAERLNRRWLGSELGMDSTEVIIKRLRAGGGEFHPNDDLVIRDQCPACVAKGNKTKYPDLPEWYTHDLFSPTSLVPVVVRDQPATFESGLTEAEGPRNLVGEPPREETVLRDETPPHTP